MNRRDLLKAVLAMPVVAALAPLLPKSVSRSWISPDIDLVPAAPAKAARFFRVKATSFTTRPALVPGGASVWNLTGDDTRAIALEVSDDAAGPWRAADRKRDGVWLVGGPEDDPIIMTAQSVERRENPFNIQSRAFDEGYEEREPFSFHTLGGAKWDDDDD